MAGTEDATLAIRDQREFGKNYELFGLTIMVDGCLFYNSEDTRVLDQPSMTVAAQPITSGIHRIEIVSRYRSGFTAQMHDYDWWARSQGQMQITAGSTQTLVIRRTEVMHRDPRQRMQTDISFE
jgi:hypothetical protein